MKISHRMIIKLNECFKRELKYKGAIPYLAEEMKSSLSGLYKSGFIATRMETIDNKKLLCIYITQEGKNFLSGLEEDKIHKF